MVTPQLPPLSVLQIHVISVDKLDMVVQCFLPCVVPFSSMLYRKINKWGQVLSVKDMTLSQGVSSFRKINVKTWHSLSISLMHDYHLLSPDLHHSQFQTYCLYLSLILSAYLLESSPNSSNSGRDSCKYTLHKIAWQILQFIYCGR